jgi:hypothetical protein
MDSVMNSRETRGSTWFAVALTTYIVAGVVVVVSAYGRGLLRNKLFWDGVTGNAMATLIQLVVLSTIAGAALYARERERWGYPRNLARARLTNAISIAWDAVVGSYDLNQPRVFYQFGSITTNVAPDFQALLAPSEILKRQEVGKARTTSEKYAPKAFATELTTLIDNLPTVIDTLENTLALFGSQCDPDVWTAVLRGIEEIQRFRWFVSAPNLRAADLEVLTDVVLDTLAETGEAITRNAPRESPDAHLKRLLCEADERNQEIHKALGLIRK